jgi:hypothetical protein
LVAECTDRFRAVFSFGPVEDVTLYPDRVPPTEDPYARRERQIRSPGRWLHSIKNPTFVFEGTVDGNLESLQAMKQVATNPKVQLLAVEGANHFNILAPTNRLIAQKILKDVGPEPNIAFTPEELNKPFGK